MHPHTRVLFDKWMGKLEKCEFLTAENLFETRTTMCDAMSVYCK